MSLLKQDPCAILSARHWSCPETGRPDGKNTNRWSGTANVQNRISLLLSTLPWRMSWPSGWGQAAHVESSPASRLPWHISIHAILGASVHLSPQDLGIFQHSQVGNLLFLTITSEGLWPNYSKGVSTEHLRDQSQLAVLAWYAGSMTELLCRTATLWASPISPRCTQAAKPHTPKSHVGSNCQQITALSSFIRRQTVRLWSLWLPFNGGHRNTEITPIL